MKLCGRCGQTKAIDAFHRQGDRRHSWCKDCYNAYAKERRAGGRRYTKEQRRRWNMRARYGMTPADMQALLSAQGGVCAICGTAPKRPCIDHDHATGRVRGILCHPCNVLLPGVERSAWRSKAQAYLSRNAAACEGVE